MRENNRVERLPEPSEKDVDALEKDVDVLAVVLKALQPLSPDDRKRVLYAATAFYRVPT